MIPIEMRRGIESAIENGGGGSCRCLLITPDTVCAGFGVRFVAAIIDGFILVIPLLLLDRLIATDQLLNLATTFLLQLLYFGYFWTGSGATPGKSAMGLKVVDQHGNLLTIERALIRYAATWLSGICLGLGYLWVLWDPKHETWHDKIAGSKVVRVR